MSEPMIRLENIGKSYDGGKNFAVRNINLTIEKGEFVALLGPSGCGKSTTLMMLCGLYRPTEGSIFFNGRYVNNVMPKDRNIGMVFQSYALYPNMSIYENIAFPLRQMRMGKNEIKERVESVAKLVKIEDYLKRMPAQLSGGQQQRVAMCRALVKNPDILLLDEPMSNLDARLKLEIRNEIKNLQERIGVTSIIVTHDQEEAMAISTHIAVIDRGALQQYDEPDELYSHPNNLFVASFIGNPPMNFINGTLRTENGKITCTTMGGELKIPDGKVKYTGELNGKDIVLGIRPHNFILTDHDEGALKMSMDYVEHLGKEFLIHCYIGDTKIRLTIPATGKRIIEDSFYAVPDFEFVSIFDSQTGKIISK